MESLFKILFQATNNNKTTSDYEQNILKNIERNSLLLKRNLSKKDKKLLYTI